MTKAGIVFISVWLAMALASAEATSQTPTQPEKPTTKQPLILLYDSLPDLNASVRLTSMNAESWMNVTQDPASYKSGEVDIDAAIKQVEKRTGGMPPKWMMLDCEDPFMANLKMPAESKEHQRSLNSMIRAIRAMKERFPQCKWTFYGIPSLSYWLNGKGWATASSDDRRKAIQDAAKIYSTLVSEVDWVSVSIYDVYDPRMVVAGSPTSIRGTPESVREDGRAWRIAQVGLAKLLSGGKPVIPTVCPFWAPTGIAPYCRMISTKDFMLDQVQPAVSAGAAGIALWTSMDYRIEQVTRSDQPALLPSKENNFGISEWRSALTLDFFDGIPPKDWTDPSVVEQLVKKTSRVITDDLVSIRTWERTDTLP